MAYKEKIYNTIKFLLSPFLLRFFLDIYVKIKRKNNIKFRELKENDSAVIIGNGPSLNDSIKNDLDFIKQCDCFMVNHAIESDYFDIIKPRYYVVIDPYYFSNDKNDKKTNDLLKSFLNKVTWEMFLFLPQYSKDSYIVKELEKNANICILYLCSFSINEIYELKKEKLFRYWNKNMIAPFSQTVLNTATSISISMNYKSIYLIGADTSWAEMLIVDQNNNDLYLNNKHFYDDEKLLVSNYNANKSNLAEELGCIKKALEAYQTLKEYANYNDSKLYNSSCYSMIDCIERKNMN